MDHPYFCHIFRSGLKFFNIESISFIFYSLESNEIHMPLSSCNFEVTNVHIQIVCAREQDILCLCYTGLLDIIIRIIIITIIKQGTPVSSHFHVSFPES